MITFLKTWSNQIIVATIIAIILEMILPNGNNKKYIKMIIGIYVLFTIISPVIAKITGNSLAFKDFDYSKYFDDTIETYTDSNEFEQSNSELIKQAYIDNIENDIKSKIKQKGYEVTKLKINIIEDENSEKYGTITNITMNINKIIDNSEDTEISNNINIEKVEINVNNTNGKHEESEENLKAKLSDNDIVYIKEYLSNEYSIDERFININ